MNNAGNFKVGTQFVGNVNKAKMEIVKIERECLGTESGRLREASSETVTIKDLKTGRKFTYGLKALEMCDVTIFES